MRVEDHPVLGRADTSEEITFSFEGQPVIGKSGEVVAAALLAAGVRGLREPADDGPPRGLYCGIGHCFECQVTVDGRAGVRACITPVRAGMRVERGRRGGEAGTGS